MKFSEADISQKKWSIKAGLKLGTFLISIFFFHEVKPLKYPIFCALLLSLKTPTIAPRPKVERGAIVGEFSFAHI